MLVAGRRRWLALAAVLLLAGAAVVAVLVVRDRHRDPRAYDVSSNAVSLDEGLRRADMHLPACLADKLKFALVDNGFGYYYTIYLRLQADKNCMQSFVDANAMKPLIDSGGIGPATKERTVFDRPSWMDDNIIDRLGWDLSPQQRFQEFDAGNPSNNYQTTAFFQYLVGSDEMLAYVYAFHGG